MKVEGVEFGSTPPPRGKKLRVALNPLGLFLGEGLEANFQVGG